MKTQIENLTNELKKATPEELAAYEDILSDLRYTAESKRDQVKRWKEEQDYKRLQILKAETSFIEPSFNHFDDEEEYTPTVGSVKFSSKEQCDEFIKLLNKQSYYYYYTIDWQGPGEYQGVSTYDYRCGEIEYTTHLTKTEEK